MTTLLIGGQKTTTNYDAIPKEYKDNAQKGKWYSLNRTFILKSDGDQPQYAAVSLNIFQRIARILGKNYFKDVFGKKQVIVMSKQDQTKMGQTAQKTTSTAQQELTTSNEPAKTQTQENKKAKLQEQMKKTDDQTVKTANTETKTIEEKKEPTPEKKPEEKKPEEKKELSVEKKTEVKKEVKKTEEPKKKEVPPPVEKKIEEPKKKEEEKEVPPPVIEEPKTEEDKKQTILAASKLISTSSAQKSIENMTQEQLESKANDLLNFIKSLPTENTEINDKNVRICKKSTLRLKLDDYPQLEAVMNYLVLSGKLPAFADNNKSDNNGTICLCLTKESINNVKDKYSIFTKEKLEEINNKMSSSWPSFPDNFDHTAKDTFEYILDAVKDEYYLRSYKNNNSTLKVDPERLNGPAITGILDYLVEQKMISAWSRDESDFKYYIKIASDDKGQEDLLWNDLNLVNSLKKFQVDKTKITTAADYNSLNQIQLNKVNSLVKQLNQRRSSELLSVKFDTFNLSGLKFLLRANIIEDYVEDEGKTKYIILQTPEDKAKYDNEKKNKS